MTDPFTSEASPSVIPIAVLERPLQTPQGGLTPPLTARTPKFSSEQLQEMGHYFLRWERLEEVQVFKVVLMAVMTPGPFFHLLGNRFYYHCDPELEKPVLKRNESCYE